MVSHKIQNPDSKIRIIFRFRVEAYEFTQNEHVGTHMDAPLHFVENGRPIDQIPMEQLAGNGKMNSSYCLGGLKLKVSEEIFSLSVISWGITTIKS